jgi:hypothetical protein
MIETIPRIGPVLTAAIIGEADSIHLFSDALKLGPYVGLNATTKQSGGFVDTRNRMSKCGFPELWGATWFTAVSAWRFAPDLDVYYQAKKQHGKRHMVATEVVGRRLVHLIYSVCARNSHTIRITGGSRQAELTGLLLQLSKCKFATLLLTVSNTSFINSGRDNDPLALYPTHYSPLHKVLL